MTLPLTTPTAATPLRMKDVRCPHCGRLLFKAGYELKLNSLVEIKCQNCGLIVTFYPSNSGKGFFTEKELRDT